MINFLNDQPSDIAVRNAAAEAAMALMNASAALARVKSRRMSNGRADREAIAAAKLAVAAAQVAFDSAAIELASAYENAMITVRNAVHGIDCQIPRRNRGTINDPSMEAYHSF
jgi:hypothetical protein